MFVNLRPLRPSDWPLLKAIELDAESKRYGDDQAFTEEELYAFLLSEHNLEEHAQFRWVICPPNETEGLGFIDLFEADFEQRRAWIGILLLPEARRKGVGSQALGALLNQLPELGIDTLLAEVQPDNVPSVAFFQKNGFQKHAQKGENWVFIKSALPKFA